MSKKQDIILNHIKNLEIGSKVSIRSLADELDVSEGTAYKAIKKAEEAGYVHTRPRAGTVRIETPKALQNIYTSDIVSSANHSGSTVEQWMHRPEYLYYNDMLADWHRTYFPVFSLNNKFAIVNDDLNICGSLNASAIIHASPEEHIYNLYDSQADFSSFTLPKTATIHEAAKKMITNNTELLFTEEDGKLQGYITANDLLRFYQIHHSPSETLPLYLLKSSAYKDFSCHLNYTISDKTAVSKTSLLSLMTNIANEHVKQFHGEKDFQLSNGSFYTDAPIEFHSEFNVHSEIVRLSETHCMCEITLSAETSNTWKYIFSYTLN